MYLTQLKIIRKNISFHCIIVKIVFRTLELLKTNKLVKKGF